MSDSTELGILTTIDDAAYERIIAASKALNECPEDEAYRRGFYNGLVQMGGEVRALVRQLMPSFDEAVARTGESTSRGTESTASLPVSPDTGVLAAADPEVQIPRELTGEIMRALRGAWALGRSSVRQDTAPIVPEHLRVGRGEMSRQMSESLGSGVAARRAYHDYQEACVEWVESLPTGTALGCQALVAGVRRAGLESQLIAYAPTPEEVDRSLQSAARLRQGCVEAMTLALERALGYRTTDAAAEPGSSRSPSV